MAKRHTKRKTDAISQIESALLAGSPFHFDELQVSREQPQTFLILDTSRLFGRDSVVLQYSTDSEFDAILLLRKFEQAFNAVTIQEMTGGNLLLAVLNGSFDQRRAVKDLKDAFQTLKGGSSGACMEPEPPRKPKPHPCWILRNLQVNAGAFYRIGVNRRIDRTTGKQGESFKDEEAKAAFPSRPVDNAFSGLKVSDSKLQFAKAIEDLKQANEAQRRAKQRLVDLVRLEKSVRGTTFGDWQSRAVGEQEQLVPSSSDGASDGGRVLEDKLGELILPNHPSSSRQEYAASVQDDLLSNVGITGNELAMFAHSVGPLLTSSGLLVRRADLFDAGPYVLDVSDREVYLRDIASSKRERIRELPSLVVSTIESVKSPTLSNQLAFSKIQLLPKEAAEKLEILDFFEYFDRIRPHVPTKELAKQFQKWLDAIPSEGRDFGDDLDRKREFARGINSRAKAIGFRFRCGKEGCGLPSGLSVVAYGTTTHGMFVFKHPSPTGGASHAKSELLPRVILCSENTKNVR